MKKNKNANVIFHIINSNMLNLNNKNSQNIYIDKLFNERQRNKIQEMSEEIRKKRTNSTATTDKFNEKKEKKQNSSQMTA